MRAYSLLRDSPWYRKQAFERGLQRVGYEVVQGNGAGRPGDVLLIWNRYAHWHEMALQFERAGGTVLVAENGYLGKGGSSPKFDVHPGGPKPWHYYSLAIGWHNGRGRWPRGGPERLNQLGVELAPWRTGGDYVLVCANRSFGVGEQVMPGGWAQRCAERVRNSTARPVRIRAHPGNDEPRNAPLAADLQGATVVVLWSSSVAVHALAAGIPTFIEAPYQIVKGAGARGSIDAPELPDRRPHFERMAWAQWRIEELETGEPFRHLLQPAGQGEVAPNP